MANPIWQGVRRPPPPSADVICKQPRIRLGNSSTKVIIDCHLKVELNIKSFPIFLYFIVHVDELCVLVLQQKKCFFKHTTLYDSSQKHKNRTKQSYDLDCWVLTKQDSHIDIYYWIEIETWSLVCYRASCFTAVLFPDCNSESEEFEKSWAKIFTWFVAASNSLARLLV